MIDEKDIKEAEKNISNYLGERMLTKDPSNARFVSFYQNNAKMSYQLANFLQNLSTQSELKQQCGFPADYECLLWVVVTSYYSMFYAANAALAKIGLKVTDKVPHKVTQDALIVYFLKNRRLAKSLLDDYKETKTEVLTLMNVNEEQLLEEFQMKAKELVATFDYQRRKRGEFQYEIKTGVKQQVAQLSLDRAKNFIHEMNGIIEKMRTPGY